jgi:hypothetical protein
MAQPAGLMPDAFPQFFDSSGNPLTAGTLTFLATGTSTPQAVYADSTLVTPLANPLTLDGTGRPAGSIYLQPLGYKVQLKTSAGALIREADPVFDAAALATLAAVPAVQTTTSTGTQNDVVLTSLSATSQLLRCNNASQLTITGIGAPTNPGTRLTIVSVGAGDVLLSHQSLSSGATARLINTGTAVATPLSAGTGTATYVYDGTTQRWRLLVADQGAPIAFTPTWLGSVTNPVYGNATVTAKYRIEGLSVKVEMSITMGTTTTYGSGFWTFGLPIVSSTTGWQAMGRATDTSAVTSYVVLVSPQSSSAFALVLDASANAVQNTQPFTWASTDILVLSMDFFTS